MNQGLDVAVLFDNIVREVGRLPDHRIFGRVTNVVGLLIEVGGVEGHLSVGDHCEVIARGGRRLICEVVGFRGGLALLMPFGPLDGVGAGCRAEIGVAEPAIYPGPD